MGSKRKEYILLQYIGMIDFRLDAARSRPPLKNITQQNESETVAKNARLVTANSLAPQVFPRT